MKNFEQDSTETTPIDNLIKQSLSNIRSMIDVDTVVGKPVDMGDGCKVYPVVKITIGLLAGGGEYTNQTIIKRRDRHYPFGGGTGAGFTADPIGFLVSRRGSCELITIQNKNAWSEVMTKLGDSFGDYLKSVGKKKAAEAKKTEE